MSANLRSGEHGFSRLQCDAAMMAVVLSSRSYRKLAFEPKCFRCDSQIQRAIKTAAGIQGLVANPDGREVDSRSLWTCWVPQASIFREH